MKRRRVPNITPERWAYLKALQWNPQTAGRYVHLSAALYHYTDAAGIQQVGVEPGLTYYRPAPRTRHRAAA